MNFHLAIRTATRNVAQIQCTVNESRQRRLRIAQIQFKVNESRQPRLRIDSWPQSFCLTLSWVTSRVIKQRWKTSIFERTPKHEEILTYRFLN